MTEDMRHSAAGRKCVTALLLCLLFVVPAGANDGYLKSDEVIGVAAGSFGLVGAGYLSRSAFENSGPRWTTPPFFDSWITKTFGRTPDGTPANFMDSDRASFASIITTGVMVGALDLSHPRRERGKDFLQGQFLYYSGALAQKGVHDIFKGLVGRQRPMMRYYPEIAETRYDYRNGRGHQSFYSGHASSAFYSMTFLNKRLRDILRMQLTGSDYRDYNWITSTVTYTWATIVALTRVHAYQHYFSDVLAGAVAGWLIGEFFYDLDDDMREMSSAGSPVMVRVSFSF